MNINTVRENLLRRLDQAGYVTSVTSSREIIASRMFGARRGKEYVQLRLAPVVAQVTVHMYVPTGPINGPVSTELRASVTVVPDQLTYALTEADWAKVGSVLFQVMQNHLDQCRSEAAGIARLKAENRQAVAKPAIP